MPSDKEALLDMGFDKDRVELAVKKSGGRKFESPHTVWEFLAKFSFTVQGALQWLEENQDKSLEDIQAAEAEAAADDDDEGATMAKIAELETGQARSLVCNDCGKLFKNKDLASFHASKT